MVVALAFAATALSSCSHGDHVRITKPAAVLFVGDSLLLQSYSAVNQAARAAGWAPVIDGRFGSAINGGFTIAGWPERIAALARYSNPDVAVVELGTNGCSHCSSLAAAIDADMRPLRNVARVYWVNVKDYSRIPADPKAINDAIDAATKRWKNLRVIDLNDHFRGHPAWLAPDDVHFTTAGDQAFAQLLVAALPRLK